MRAASPLAMLASAIALAGCPGPKRRPLVAHAVEAKRRETPVLEEGRPPTGAREAARPTLRSGALSRRRQGGR
eukprot:4684640-Alexandrium_andersonii.AAC.1